MDKIRCCIFLFIVINCMPLSVCGQISYDGTECVNKRFQVATHVAVDSAMRLPLFTQEEIDEALVASSVFFEDICMSFIQCEYNIMENDYTLGIVRSVPVPVNVRLNELRSRFSKRRRINMFFLESIEDADCGIGTFEGINTLNDANIFIERDCNEGLNTQIAHQLGHIFGLLDTHHPEGTELVDGSNCTVAGDMLCSTPADPFEQSFVSVADSIRLLTMDLITDFDIECEFVYELRDPNDEFYNPLISNIMSSYPCKCSFTQEQLSVMARNYRSSPIKHF